MRAVVCGLIAELAKSRGNDGGTWFRGRPFQRASLGDQTVPLFEKAFRKHKRPVGESWRMDENYVKVGGQWKYLYRAVDKAGNTVDFLLRTHRDKAAARRYFEKAIDRNGMPETVTMDKRGANLAALQVINAERETPIKVRQIKYPNDIVEQDHRAIKRDEGQRRHPNRCRSVLFVGGIRIPCHCGILPRCRHYRDTTGAFSIAQAKMLLLKSSFEHRLGPGERRLHLVGFLLRRPPELALEFSAEL